VTLILAAAFLVLPKQRVAIVAFFSTIPLHLLLQYFVPNMNYFVRAFCVIVIAFNIIYIASSKDGWVAWKDLIQYDSKSVWQVGIGLALSLVVLHVVFH
jgi:SSS family solute:Na+ symporter